MEDRIAKIPTITGPIGPRGPEGSPGKDGERGPQGVKGDKGTTGKIISAEIGEKNYGGIVFWVDPTGNHGLVAALENLSAKWGPQTNISALRDGVGAGKLNTLLIAVGTGGEDSAALRCMEYKEKGNGSVYYGDWYLPSIIELKLMLAKENKDKLGLLHNVPLYWSSNQLDAVEASLQTTSSGTGSFFKYEEYPVRCIRSF